MFDRLAFVWSPPVFALLVAMALAMFWMAFVPAPPRREVRSRLDEYLDRGDVVIEETMRLSVFKRAVWPALRVALRALGRLLPNRNLEATRRRLQEAGNPAGMTPLDFYGARLLLLILAGVAVVLLSSRSQPLFVVVRNTGLALVVAFLLPIYWLRVRGRSRKNGIVRALPDALDMLTIGVEAGLAFESAMIRVGEKWDNPLTREFRRAVSEMRVGMSREDALRRMAERCGVPQLSTFVAVLVQSSQLGVSISQVLHTQADDMRVRRRQRAEELARQAGIKMIFPLAFLILPALFVVILGPTVPAISVMLRAMAGPAGGLP